MMSLKQIMEDELVEVKLEEKEGVPKYYIQINGTFVEVTEADFNNFNGNKIAGTLVKGGWSDPFHNLHH